MSKACILGTGAWGTALGQVLADNGYDVMMYGIVPNQVNDINAHRNTQYFNDHVFPESLKASSDLATCVKGAEIVVAAVPSFAVYDTVKKASAVMDSDPYVVSVSKGFDPNTDDFMFKTIRRAIASVKTHGVITLAGPSFAVEVAERLPTAVTAASPDLVDALFVQKAFSNGYFRVYSNSDEIGAECAGAIKNVIAVASGCLDGLGYSTNTRAALITRGLSEMARFALSMGGQLDTIYGLTGVGDLFLTCSSSESRNYQVGKAIGESGNAKAVLAKNTLTAEGVRTALVLHNKAVKSGIEMPICESVYQVLYEGKSPKGMVDLLMSRPLRSEVL